MRHGTSVRASGLAVALLAMAGCGQQGPTNGQAANEETGTTEAREYDVKVASAEDKLTRPPGRPAASDDAPKTLAPAATPEATPLPLDQPPAEELVMPKVILSEAHKKLCRVLVGDSFPDLTLPDTTGKTHRLGDLMGDKLTVVAFWNGQKPAALEELADLGPQVAKPFAEDGVAVVGINSGDSPQLAAELAGQAGGAFVNLVDPDGSALAQVGTGKIPRTYLLDASGKIVWFDIEYSRTTRRQLAQAIQYLLAQP